MLWLSSAQRRSLLLAVLLCGGSAFSTASLSGDVSLPPGRTTTVLPPKMEPATGRFALQNYDDYGWVLHRPDGSPTFLLALNHLSNPKYFDVIEGASGLAPCHPYDAECLKVDLLGTKYGGNWSAATKDFVHFSKAWGFNSAGYEYVPTPEVSWSYLPDLFITNASYIFKHSADYRPSFPDVFGLAFNASTDTRVQSWISTDQHIDRPRVLSEVVGYYFEDQALWNVSLARSGVGSDGPRPKDWTDAMRTLPSSAPGKAAYVTWLEQRYHSRGGLEQARKVYAMPSHVQAWLDVRSYDFDPLDLLSPTVVADDTDFLAVVADRYFSIASAAVHRHDPAALVFGQRFIGQDIVPGVIAAAGRHFDVISVQPSPFSFGDDQEARASAQELARVSALAGGRPVFVADQTSHFVQDITPPNTTFRAPCWTDKSGKVHGCGANASAAGALYAAYLSELRARPEIIGYSHCQVGVGVPVPIALVHCCRNLCVRATPAAGSRIHTYKHADYLWYVVSSVEQYINRAVCPGSADARRATECSAGANPPHVGLKLKQGMLHYNGTPQTPYVNLVAAANRKYGY
jgi:hypothetical protein